MSNILPEIVNDPDLIIETPPQSDTEDDEPEPVRENINTDEIFVKQKKTAEPVVAPVKKEKKPRKPMSEEHKEKLKLARQKAVEARKQKATQKDKHRFVSRS